MSQEREQAKGHSLEHGRTFSQPRLTSHQIEEWYDLANVSEKKN